MSKQIIKSRVNLLGETKGIVLGKKSLKIVYKSHIRRLKYSSILGFCKIERSVLGHKIEITTHKETIVVNGLSHLKATPQFNKINLKIKRYIESKIELTHSTFFTAVLGQYLRESKISKAQSIVEPITQLFSKHHVTWKQHISTKHYNLLDELSKHVPVTVVANSLRKQYVTNALAHRKSFYDTIERNPLTPEQRTSVVQHDDYNMVLAAAGTGKTSVMVAKTTDILVQKMAKPEEVMVLAYGKDAADELKDRAKERLKAANITFNLDNQISTFHSRGYQIIAEVDKTTVEDFKRLSMSWLRKDKNREEFINNWLVTFIEDSDENLNAFIDTVYYAYDPFLATSEEEHQDALKGKKYKTLNGVEVKSYQEVLIGNWLFKNGIKYKYEPNFSHEIGQDIGFTYHPDFQVSGTNVFIEHFGIDINGNTRAGIDKDDYNEKIAQKIELHKHIGTRLVDTYHYNWCDGELEQKLQDKLASEGIYPNPISTQKVIEAIEQQDFIKNAVAELKKTLASVRAEDIEGDEILQRLKKAKIRNAQNHMYLIESLRQAYVDELGTKIDYDDMILKAKKYIQAGKYKPKWKFILVDEFQDISASRWNLLMELLKAPDSSLTVVGDDWQAIYAFTGGKLEYTTDFQEKVGNHALTKLQKTFRYNNSIADTAGAFIMKNDKQHKKHINTHTNVTEPEVYLMDNQDDKEKDPVQATLNAVEREIHKIIKDEPEASIAILSRYNKTKNAAKEKFESKLGLKNMSFWSLHGSKGLEAQYCFILDLNQGFFGFPTERKESEIVSALMPTTDNYPHAEERRLFYVAMTRSKKRCYLVADPKEPSEFVLELLNPEYKLCIISEHFTPERLAARKCPNCKTGYMKPKKGQWGVYDCSTGLGCTTSLGHPTEAVECHVCDGLAVKSDHHAKCVNCRTKFQLCPNCRAPKVVRTNQKYNSLFVGCSSFRGDRDKSCRFSSSLSPTLKRTLKDKDRIPC